MQTAQLICQHIQQWDNALPCFCFSVYNTGPVLFFEPDGFVDANCLSLKIYVFVNVQSKYFSATQASVQHHHNSRAEFVLRFVDKIPFFFGDGPMRP